MKKVLLILGKETGPFAKGEYNTGLFEAAREMLSGFCEVKTTVIEDGYTSEEEIAKFQWADVVIYQYPVYWFTMPPTMKRYLDSVYANGSFFAFHEGPYGSDSGLMKGKKVMFSTTWNAPTDAFDDPNAFFEGRSVEDVLLPIRKAHHYCGFEELPHFFSHNIIKEPRFEADRARLVDHLHTLFAPASAEA